MYQVSFPSVGSTLRSSSTKTAKLSAAYFPQPGSLCTSKYVFGGPARNHSLAIRGRRSARVRHSPSGLKHEASWEGLALARAPMLGKVRLMWRKAGLACSQVVRLTSEQAISIQKG